MNFQEEKTSGTLGISASKHGSEWCWKLLFDNGVKWHGHVTGVYFTNKKSI